MQENFLEDNFEQRFVLDVSCLPFLKPILADMTDNEKPITVSIPGILKKLLVNAEQNPQYYAYFFNLVRRWTKKELMSSFFNH